jgi:VanZ family protein
MPSPHRRRRRRSSQSRSHATARDPFATARSQPLDAAGLWLVLAGIYWLMLLMAMHFPGHSIPPELRPEEGSDGVFHCLAYLLFSFLICRAFDGMHRRRYPNVNPPVLIYLFIFLACITYGYVDEETQPWTGRTADPADWEADVLGSLLGVCAHLFVSVFFTADPAQLVLDRFRRRHRRHSHRRRSKHRSGEHHPSAGSRSSDADGERQNGDGSARSRRRRRPAAETHDDAEASAHTVDASSNVEPPVNPPPPEIPPPQSEQKSLESGDSGQA